MDKPEAANEAHRWVWVVGGSTTGKKIRFHGPGGRAGLPFVGFLLWLVAAGFFSTLLLSGSHGLPRRHPRALSLLLPPPVDVPDDALLAPFAWLASALALALVLLAALVLVVRVLGKIPELEVRGRILCGVVAAAAGVWGWREFSATGDEPVEKLLSALAWVPCDPDSSSCTSEFISRPFSGQLTDTGTLVIGVLLLVAFCNLSRVYPRGKDGVPLEEAARLLLDRRRSLNLLLFISAAILSVGVVQIHWTFLLPGNAGLLGVSQAGLGALASGISLCFGAAFSLLVLAVYGPAAWVHAQDCEALAKKGASTHEERKKWLKTRGLDDSMWQQLGRVAAVIAPLASGWLGPLTG